MQVELTLHSIKKHSVRYDVADDYPESVPCVRSLYVTKVHVPSPPPKTILVTVTLPPEED